jgi:hypothetical protein
LARSPAPAGVDQAAQVKLALALPGQALMPLSLETRMGLEKAFIGFLMAPDSL